MRVMPLVALVGLASCEPPMSSSHSDTFRFFLPLDAETSFKSARCRLDEGACADLCHAAIGDETAILSGCEVGFGEDRVVVRVHWTTFFANDGFWEDE